MGSSVMIRDLRRILSRLKPWEGIYGPFPLVIPFGGFILVPNLGKEYIEGKEEEPKTT